MALDAHACVDDGALRGLILEYAVAARGLEEGESADVEEGRRAGSTNAAKDATALAAVVSALENAEGGAAVEVVTRGARRVGLWTLSVGGAVARE